MKKNLFIIVLVLAMFTAACSNGGGNTPTPTNGNNGSVGSNTNGFDKEANVVEEPTEISIMTHFFGATPPRDDNPFELAVEEATNTKLSIQWNSANNYLDKLNVTMASGALTDLVLIPNSVPLTNPVFMEAVKNNVFWELSPFIDDYPNLKGKISEVAWDLTKINGGNYFIPRPRPSEAAAFFVFRQDWLNNLGLSVPTTDEEFYEVIRAFTYDDPDQNGLDDTVGFLPLTWGTSMGDLMQLESIFTGVHGNWKDDNGQLVYTDFLPEMRDAIEFSARAYAEGLYALDFVSLTPNQKGDVFNGGKIGATVETTGTFKSYADVMSGVVPGFEITDLVQAVNINGYNPKASGFNGGNAIPKTVPEEKVKKILAMIDRWMEDDLFLMHGTGVEGIHHTVNAQGEIEVDSEKVSQDALGEYGQIVNVADPYSNSYKADFPDEAKESLGKHQDERAKTSVGPVAVGLVTESSQQYLPEFEKNTFDMKIKIILGHEPITAWDSLVEKMKNDPNMQKVIEEINELYQSRK